MFDYFTVSYKQSRSHIRLWDGTGDLPLFPKMYSPSFLGQLSGPGLRLETFGLEGRDYASLVAQFSVFNPLVATLLNQDSG